MVARLLRLVVWVSGAAVGLACARAPRVDAPRPGLPSASAAPVSESAPERSRRDAPARTGCLDDPYAHAVRLLLEHYGDQVAERTDTPPSLDDYDKPDPVRNCTSVESLPDLDGDAVDEIEVTEGCTFGTYAWLHVRPALHHRVAHLLGAMAGTPRPPGALLRSSRGDRHRVLSRGS